MTRFKDGEKVRYIGEKYGDQFTPGNEYVVSGDHDSWCSVISDDGGRRNGRNGQYFEPVSSAPEPSPIKMKPVLVPGTYGRIQVEASEAGSVSVRHLTEAGCPSGIWQYTALELRSLAMVASQLAEFLERDEQ